MIITLVHIHVKEEHLEAFKAATIDNASNSYQEPGCVRFDAIQQEDDPTRFVLIEAYRTQADVDAHKQTEHYARWRDTVNDMMAERRYGVRHTGVYPGDEAW